MATLNPWLSSLSSVDAPSLSSVYLVDSIPLSSLSSVSSLIEGFKTFNHRRHGDNGDNRGGYPRKPNKTSPLLFRGLSSLLNFMRRQFTLSRSVISDCNCLKRFGEEHIEGMSPDPGLSSFSVKKRPEKRPFFTSFSGLFEECFPGGDL